MLNQRSCRACGVARRSTIVWRNCSEGTLTGVLDVSTGVPSYRKVMQAQQQTESQRESLSNNITTHGRSKVKLHRVKPGDPQSLRHLGFTLIELCIVVVIVAILAAVAIPSYQKYVRDSRRQEAQQGLLTLSLLMERSFARAGSYPIALPSADLPTAYYTFSLDASSSSATSFKIQAAPTGAQSGDSCGTMTLNQAGQKTPANCWR